MTEKDIQELHKLIDNIQKSYSEDVLIFTYNEGLVTKIQKLLPGCRVIFIHGHSEYSENDNKIYIIPVDKVKPIKIHYE